MPLNISVPNPTLSDEMADSKDKEISDFLESSCPWPDEQACIEALFRSRWPDGFRCPFCQHAECYVISTRRLPLYDCKRCREQMSLTAGTVFHKSPTPLLKWFRAISLQARMAGISAVRLSRAINVTYKTAWLIGHKLRKIMGLEGDKQPLDGNVFVTDLIFYHQKFASGAHWQPEEQCVMVGGVLDDQEEVEHVIIKHVPREEAPSRNFEPDFLPFQRDFVAPASRTTMVYKARKSSYRRLPRLWPQPRGEAALMIKQADRARDKQLRAIVEWAECWITWTFCGIGPKHLQAYLDQFCYAWHRQDATMAESFLQECTAMKAITYSELTGNATKNTRISAA